MAQPHVANPRTLTVDWNPAYPRAVADMKSDGQLSRRTCLRQCKCLNNIVEQDRRRIKRLVRPGLGFGSFHSAANFGGFRGHGDDEEGTASKD
jgi:transposase, IS6 family